MVPGAGLGAPARGLWPAGAAAVAALLPFAWSDVTGPPLAALPLDQIIGGPRSYLDAVPFLVCSMLALIISTSAGATWTRKGVVAPLVLIGSDLVPLTPTGHVQHGPVMAYARPARVVAPVVWIGGLAGPLLYVHRSPPPLAGAVPRFDRMALGC
jgi:hypothetical protein